MESPEVRQLGPLSDLFAKALTERHPRSVAILGVAGGNGLDRIDPSVTSRIVGVDINHRYLHAVQERYAPLPGLELCCVDLAKGAANLEPVELVHAALIFEHAGIGRCLDNALALVADGGALSVVLQLPSETAEEVPSHYPSITKIKSDFSLVDRVLFCSVLEKRHFRLIHDLRKSLPGGKGFWMGIFVRN